LNANELIYLLHALRHMPHQVYAQQMLALWRWIPLLCLAAARTISARLYPRRMRLQKGCRN
jgi:hypothetical protein